MATRRAAASFDGVGEGGSVSSGGGVGSGTGSGHRLGAGLGHRLRGGGRLGLGNGHGPGLNLRPQVASPAPSSPCPGGRRRRGRM